MFCVACMIFASDASVKCAITLLITSKKKEMQSTYKDMRVLTSFEFSNIDCICFVQLFMICAHEVGAKCAIALRFISKNQENAKTKCKDVCFNEV